MQTYARPFLVTGVFGFLVSFACNLVYAHHSFALLFDPKEWITLEGVVTDVHFQNPHVSLEMEVANENGETELWSVETNHRAGLQPEVARGDPWMPDTLQPGDRIIAYGHPSRREGRHGIHAFSLRRPSDSWAWVWRLDSLPEEEQDVF